MNILITGGTGLIGRAVSENFRQDNHHVTILTRNPERVEKTLPSGVTAIQWDGRSPTGWAHLIEETDAVIHLAGESIAGESLPAILTRRWTNEQKKRIQQSRTDAGNALVAAIESASKKPDVLIQASAVGYYGPQGDKALSESAPAGTDFLAGVCQAWENSTAEVEKMGVRRVIIRTGLVLATEGGILPMMLLPFRLFVGGPIGGGQQAVPWIHLEDEVGALRFLIENSDAQGAYNLSAPHPVSNAEFGRVAGQALHRPNWFPLPGIALKLALGEKASLILDGQHTLPERLLEAGYKFKFETLESALSNLV